MNRDNDMRHVRSAQQFRKDDEKRNIRYIYGDAVGGASFTAAESARLEAIERKRRPTLAAGWKKVWAGPGTTLWTVIECHPETAEEIAMYNEVIASAAADVEDEMTNTWTNRR
jgi:hypothetical protein